VEELCLTCTRLQLAKADADQTQQHDTHTYAPEEALGFTRCGGRAEPAGWHEWVRQARHARESERDEEASETTDAGVCGQGWGCGWPTCRSRCDAGVGVISPSGAV
jgi:hypothetical protein